MRKVMIAAMLAGTMGLIGTTPTLSAPVSGTALLPADASSLVEVQYFEYGGYRRCERFCRRMGHGDYSRRSCALWVRRCGRERGGGYDYIPY